MSMDDLKKYQEILEYHQKLANPNYGFMIPGSNYDFYRTLLSVFGDINGIKENPNDSGILYAQDEQNFKIIKKMLKKAGIKYKAFSNLQDAQTQKMHQDPGNTLSPYPGNKKIR